MTLNEMRTLLAAEDLRLTRSLGQNFLHDGNQLRRITALAAVQPGDRVLEIGPGLGPLTEHLLAAGAQVLAVEKDHRLVPLLRRRLANSTGLEVLEADALDWLTAEPRDWSAWQVVANLPYSVGSPILVELAQAAQPPRALTVTLQSEVVDRIRARPGSGEFGVLTLLLARTFIPGPSFRIPATCFFPAPEIESACIRLDRRPSPLTADADAATYVRLVKLGFSQRRKRLRKVLRAGWDDARLGQAWSALGLHEDARPEVLSPEQFAALAQHLRSPVTGAG